MMRGLKAANLELLGVRGGCLWGTAGAWRCREHTEPSRRAGPAYQGDSPWTQGSLLRRIALEETLWGAWDEVLLARGAPGVDGGSLRVRAG
jgi:hypothetical protein